MNNIKIDKSRTVVDIQTISEEELENLRRNNIEVLEQYLKQAEEKKVSLLEAYRNSVLLGILTFMGATAKFVTVSPTVLTIGAILSGLGIALPTMDFFIRRLIRKKKIRSNQEEYEEIKNEIDRRVFEEKREKAENELQDLIQAIKNTKLNNYNRELVDREIEYYQKNGADEKLLQLPGIRRIFEIAIQPFYASGVRFFLHQDKRIEIQKDGTFTVGTKKRFGSGEIEIIYKISYCQNGDDNHYIQIDRFNKRIYLDKDGEFSCIEEIVEHYNHREVINIPLNEAKRNRNKLNAAMATLLEMEESLSKEEKTVPTIDFGKIKEMEDMLQDQDPEDPVTPMVQESGYNK